MGRRSRLLLVILCLSTGLFTIIVWRTGKASGGNNGAFDSLLISSSSSFGEYFGGAVESGRKGVISSLFRIPKIGVEGESQGKDDGGEEEHFGGPPPGDDVEDKTVVLMWTKYYNNKDEQLMGDIFSGRKYDPDCCTGDDLIVTLDRSMLSRATVVVFYNYFGNLVKKDLPQTRPPGQLWVLFSKESPTLSLTLHQFPNRFNWTMTYRRDSDIWSPYGFTEPLAIPIPPDEPILMPGDIPLPEWVAKKKYILTGVISHCPTPGKRERVIAALRNSSLPVDIFGGCGNRTICPRSRKSCDHAAFWKKLGEEYKFYFAAENSRCVDYITEKFWRTLERGMVPLVYGGANYTAVAPPHSFIDVSEFQSPKEVADFLKNVANDPIEYAKYFEWKRNYNVTLTDGWGGWCTLCRLARQYRTDPENMDISPNKTYKHLGSWWLMQRKGKSKACTRKPPFPL